MNLETTHVRLPLSLDEIDAEWLTFALGTRFSGVEVAALKRDAERAGTSTSARFHIDYASDGGHSDIPASIYIKGGFDPVMRRRVWAALIMEARFYAELAPYVPAHIPKAFFAGIDEENRQGVVILEDMAARSVKFGNIADPIPIDTVYKTAEQLAKMHGKFWNSDRLNTYSDWKDPQRTYLTYLFRQKHWDEVINRPYGDALVKLFANPQAAIKGLQRMWELNDQRPRTLVHGDCHSGNLFYEPDGKPGIMDWQCPFPGWVGHDLGENLLTSLTIEDRRKHDRDIIENYREVLKASGGGDETPSADEIYLSYRQNITHMMASGVMNPYDMQTVEVTDMSAGRVLAAANDLDLLEALDLKS